MELGRPPKGKAKKEEKKCQQKVSIKPTKEDRRH
jgi:hypothetical protein